MVGVGGGGTAGGGGGGSTRGVSKVLFRNFLGWVCCCLLVRACRNKGRPCFLMLSLEEVVVVLAVFFLETEGSSSLSSILAPTKGSS